MKITNEFLLILNNLKSLNNKVIIQSPTTIVVNESNTMVGYFDVEGIESPLYIGDITKFLNIIKLFKEVNDIVITDSYIEFKNSEMTQQLFFENPEIFKDQEKNPQEIITKFSSYTTGITFELQEKKLQKIKEMIHTIKPQFAQLRLKDGIIFEMGMEDFTGEYISDKGTYILDSDFHSDNEIKVELNIDNLLKVMNTDYVVEILNIHDINRLKLKSNISNLTYIF